MNTPGKKKLVNFPDKKKMFYIIFWLNTKQSSKYEWTPCVSDNKILLWESEELHMVFNHMHQPFFKKEI